MNRQNVLRRRIQWLTWFFITGLVVSGATAIPLSAEVGWLTGHLSPEAIPSSLTIWLNRVQAALQDTAERHPFLFYGTDWLAFGHFMIAIVFVGALRDPVRNRWLFDFGLIACVLVIPYALAFGGLREIPIGWRLIDCAFGVGGFVPLWLCRQWARELELAVTSPAQDRRT